MNTNLANPSTSRNEKVAPATTSPPAVPLCVVQVWGKFWRGHYQDRYGQRHPIRTQRTEAAAWLAVAAVRRKAEGGGSEPARPTTIDMTDREKVLFDAVSKEALFALARAFIEAQWPSDWVRVADWRITALAENGVIPSKQARPLDRAAHEARLAARRPLRVRGKAIGRS